MSLKTLAVFGVLLAVLTLQPSQAKALEVPAWNLTVVLYNGIGNYNISNVVYTVDISYDQQVECNNIASLQLAFRATCFEDGFANSTWFYVANCQGQAEPGLVHTPGDYWHSTTFYALQQEPYSASFSCVQLGYNYTVPDPEPPTPLDEPVSTPVHEPVAVPVEEPVAMPLDEPVTPAPVPTVSCPLLQPAPGATCVDGRWVLVTLNTTLITSGPLFVAENVTVSSVVILGLSSVLTFQNSCSVNFSQVVIELDDADLAQLANGTFAYQPVQFENDACNVTHLGVGVSYSQRSCAETVSAKTSGLAVLFRIDDTCKAKSKMIYVYTLVPICLVLVVIVAVIIAQSRPQCRAVFRPYSKASSNRAINANESSQPR